MRAPVVSGRSCEPAGERAASRDYSDELERAAAAAVAQLARYVEASQRGEGPAIANPPLGDVMADLDLRRRLREGGMDAESFGAFLGEYLARTTRLHHPGALAHQVAVPDVPSALADLVHGVINNPMAIYEMGAAAATIEVAVLEWMIEKIGWPRGGGRRADPRRLAGRADRDAGGPRAGGARRVDARRRRRPGAARAALGALLDQAGGRDPRPRRGRRGRARDRRARAHPARADRRRPGADAGGRPAPDRARGGGVRDEHRAARRPASRSASSAASAACGCTSTRARRLGAALRAPRRPARRHRARRLGRLGRAQDAAHVEPLRGRAGAARRRPRRRVPPGRQLPLLRHRARGRRRDRARGRVHEGARSGSSCS